MFWVSNPNLTLEVSNTVKAELAYTVNQNELSHLDEQNLPSSL